MKKEIEIQRIRKRYLKEIVCQSRKWLVEPAIVAEAKKLFGDDIVQVID